MLNFANSQDGCFGTGCFCTRLQKRLFRHNVPNFHDCRNGCFGTSTIAETDVSAHVPKLFLAETFGSRLNGGGALRPLEMA